MNPVGSSGPLGGDRAVATALRFTHDWFEVNSGWAPPDPATLVDWGLEGIGRAPDDCLVTERGVCRHGLVSWQVVLDDLEESDSDNVGALPAPAGGPVDLGDGSARLTGP